MIYYLLQQLESRSSQLKIHDNEKGPRRIYQQHQEKFESVNTEATIDIDLAWHKFF